MHDDIKTLRKLAVIYYRMANNEDNYENIRLHRAVNDLRQIRPVVLIDELPWHEMGIGDELKLVCQDPWLQRFEWFFRSQIYKKRHMPADMIMQPYLPVQRVIHTKDLGLEVSESILATDNESSIVSHDYKDILSTEEDLEKIKDPVVIYDHEKTMKNYEKIGDILGDIIPVKLTGIPYLGVVTWDDIARYRGVTNLLIDLAERPEFMHMIVRKLTDAKISYMEQIEALGLFDNDPYPLHCTPIHTSQLPSGDYMGERITLKDIWGRGTAQIFASVSKQMHYEFDIEYMKETIGRCGLSYYGCCEPLDKKIDILEKLPNLRKISITPWADVRAAAEGINTKYVLSSKPNPATVSESILDKDNLRKEIKAILSACKEHGCSCDIVLKDISTCHRRPENIFEWEKTVMELIKCF